MKPIPWRAQIGLVAAGYLAVILVSALLLYERHLVYLRNAAEAASAGGMYAGGDLMLALFILGLFLMQTFVLVLVIRKSEAAYTVYSQILFFLSLTAPVCLGLMAIPAVNQASGWYGEIFLYRLFLSPLLLVGFIGSRLFARFVRAKRLTSYASLIEAGTLILIVGAFLLFSRR